MNPLHSASTNFLAIRVFVDSSPNQPIFRQIVTSGGFRNLIGQPNSWKMAANRDEQRLEGLGASQPSDHPSNIDWLRFSPVERGARRHGGLWRSLATRRGGPRIAPDEAYRRTVL